MLFWITHPVGISDTVHPGAAELFLVFFCSSQDYAFVYYVHRSVTETQGLEFNQGKYI